MKKERINRFPDKLWFRFFRNAGDSFHYVPVRESVVFELFTNGYSLSELLILSVFCNKSIGFPCKKRLFAK